MKWGFFTPTHILTLVMGAVILAALYLVLKNKSAKFQTALLFPLSCSGLVAIFYNLAAWGSPLEYLPLHLCSLNALVLPVAVLTRNKTLGNLLLVWCLGAFVALVANFNMVETEVFGEVFNMYYFPHLFEFGIPLLLFKLRLVEKDETCIGTTIGITMFIYTLVHLCNVLINNWCISVGSDIRVNYMYSLAPDNPLTALFYRLIPHYYWHMYLIIPIVAVYLAIVYAPQLSRRYRVSRWGHRTV
jgi:uncharacterized membrane protein YwaF